MTDVGTLTDTAVQLVDEMLARMGSDPCPCAFEAVADEVLEEFAPDADERDAARAAVRSHLGLHVGVS
jgi:hypothetical protein